MSIAKVIEVISEGKSIEDAVQATLTEAMQTLHNIRQINIEHVEALIENNKIAKYRVRCKVSFVLDSNRKD
ncbi:MAG: dodecin domain-containing protein [Candidatus Protochlamydia sp.]|nr:dodecin domain-containing protein [Candidatus Protochlamydia sp.]